MKGVIKMKIIKKLSLLAVVILAVLAFVGCGEYSVLNELTYVTNNMDRASKSLTSFDETSMDNNLVKLSYSGDSKVMLLSDTTDKPLQNFINLSKQIIDLHSQILLTRTDFIALRIQIKDAVDYIKTNQIMLLDDNKASIQTSIQNLKDLRQNLLDTKGQAYQKIVDLRGTYSSENLPEINQTYLDVIPVLEGRLNMFQQANTELQNIYNILNDYTE